MRTFVYYDGDGNTVRSIDISGKKEYNYEYEEGRIVRTTESDIIIPYRPRIPTKTLPFIVLRSVTTYL